MLEQRETRTPDWIDGNPIPFPGIASRDGNPGPTVDSVQFAHRAMAMADRRMQHLARMLDCLGHFDGDEDGPRAA
jgi:hypothetical protein